MDNVNLGCKKDPTFLENWTEEQNAGTKWRGMFA